MGPRSPVDAHLLRDLLRGHPRRTLASYLWSGFKFGFALGYQGTVTPARSRNLLSARSRRSALTAAVALEVSRGHTAGPFVRPPFRLFHCSPLGAALKSDGSVRLVLDLSPPRGASVNSGISREEFAVRYTSVDVAVAIVRRLGRTAFMAKADTRHSFRLCPVRPADWPLLCYTRDERVYVDLRLPFGARSSPFIFTQFAEALLWIAVHVVGASTSSIIIIFWHGPPMLRAPATCKLSRTSAATSVSPSRRRSWSWRHAASSSWASAWTPLFRRCASLRINLHGLALACPRGGRGRNAPIGSSCS